MRTSVQFPSGFLMTGAALLVSAAGAGVLLQFEMEELGLSEMHLVFAAGMAEAFEISMPPQVYVVGDHGRIAAAGRVFTAEELSKMIAGHMEPAESKIVSDARKENSLEKQTFA